MRPGRLHRIDMQEAAGRVDERCRIRDRLDHAGLVVGEHQRNQRHAGRPAEQALQRREIDDARRRSTGMSSSRRPKRPPARTDGCSIADDQQRRRPHRQDVSASMLASVPPEVKTTSRAAGADQCRDLFARVLDQTARARGPRHGPTTDCPSRPARRSWRRAPPAAAARSHSSRDRACVGIEFSSGWSDRSSNAMIVLILPCSFYLLLAPGIMLETASHPVRRRPKHGVPVSGTFRNLATVLVSYVRRPLPSSTPRPRP